MNRFILAFLFALLSFPLYAQQAKDYLQISIGNIGFSDWGAPLYLGSKYGSLNNSNFLGSYVKQISYSREITEKLWVAVSCSYFNSKFLGIEEAGNIYNRTLASMNIDCSFPFYGSINSRLNAFLNVGFSFRQRQESIEDSIIINTLGFDSFQYNYGHSYKSNDFGINISTNYKFNFYKSLYFGNTIEMQYYNKGVPTLSLLLDAGAKF